jgi:orotate phosphoribosyltransferase
VTARLTLADLSACGAHQKGHFRLSSGLHSSDYLQCAIYLAVPRRAQLAGHMLGDAVKASMVPPAMIVSPAIGGLIIGHETARALGVPFLFTERDSNGQMALRRCFSIAPNQGVIVVEDVVTTGGSIHEVIEIVEAHRAHVLGVVSLVNRSGNANPFDPVPYRTLIEADFPAWEAGSCPLCREGVAIDHPGSRPVK